jgi:hypothetical protein
LAKLVTPDSALDWFTFKQIAEAAAIELIDACPEDPKSRRIDLYREVVLGGKTVFVRIKVTIAHIIDPSKALK